MPDRCLPLYQIGDVPINSRISYREEDGKIFYFNWAMPVFVHDKNDEASFRMCIAQLCVTGAAKQVEICRAFGIPAVTMKRAVKKFREKGAGGFFTERKRRGAGVLTPEVLQKTQALFDEGKDRNEISKSLNIKSDTLYKAIKSGRLHVPEKKRIQQS